MKILQLGKFYPIVGGVEKVMWDFTAGLGERGIKCDMLCAILYKNARREKIIIHRINDNARCICVRAIAQKASTMICPGMIRYLKKHCSEYDIIHIHHPDPMAAIALWFSGYKGKVILHWHSDILKQKVLLKLYMPLLKWLIGRAWKIIGTTPVYIAASPYLKEVQAKCDYLPIGIRKIVAEESRVRAILKECSGKKIVFSLGRMIWYKGYEYLVDAAEYLPDDYVVVIGGRGPIYGDLQKRIKEKGFESRVILPGYMTDADVGAWMQACSVFALSSVSKTEAFAIVQIEAMSCSKPIVATEIPGSGVSWVNKNGCSGMNVPIRDSRALAKAIVDITSDDRTYADFCIGAYGRYAEMFTYDRMMDELLKKYEIIR